jgi:hypothetical protein
VSLTFYHGTSRRAVHGILQTGLYSQTHLTTDVSVAAAFALAEWSRGAEFGEPILIEATVDNPRQLRDDHIESWLADDCIRTIIDRALGGDILWIGNGPSLLSIEEGACRFFDDPRREAAWRVCAKLFRTVKHMGVIPRQRLRFGRTDFRSWTRCDGRACLAVPVHWRAEPHRPMPWPPAEAA